MNNELAKNGFQYKDLDMVTQVLLLILNGLQFEKVGFHTVIILAKMLFLLQFELIEALSHLLEVLNIPFEKAKSSDELKEVSKIPGVLNALCDLIFFEINLDSDPQGSLTGDWECIRQEIANTFTNIAS